MHSAISDNYTPRQLSMDELFQKAVEIRSYDNYKKQIFKYLKDNQLASQERDVTRLFWGSVLNSPLEWHSKLQEYSQHHDEILREGNCIVRKYYEMNCLNDLSNGRYLQSTHNTPILPAEFNSREDYLSLTDAEPDWSGWNPSWQKDNKEFIKNLPIGFRQVLEYWFIPDTYRSQKQHYVSKEELQKLYPETWEEIRQAMWLRGNWINNVKREQEDLRKGPDKLSPNWRRISTFFILITVAAISGIILKSFYPASKGQ